jgi:hypothetical protein
MLALTKFPPCREYLTTFSPKKLRKATLQSLEAKFNFIIGQNTHWRDV